MPRVVGCDPGTSSLDLLLLVDGKVADQARLAPGAPAGALLDRLRGWAPLDLVAGPSGYGVPLVSREDLTARHIEEMALVRPDDRGRGDSPIGLRGWIRALSATDLPVVFLPGGIHLPTIPAHRKAGAIDLGTPDKVAVGALGLAMLRRRGSPWPSFALAEIGAAFTSILVFERGRLVDASAGTRGPIGLCSGGAWDGEAAYALGPLRKSDLFRGGFADLGTLGADAFRESLRKHLAGLRAVHGFRTVVLAGSGLERALVRDLVMGAVAGLGRIRVLPSLPGAWVKHAAQGAALIADGLAGGRHADLVEALELRGAAGTIDGHLAVRRPDWLDASGGPDGRTTVP